MITVFIAAIVPNLAPVVSLFGAIFFSVLGLLCPAAIHLATFWEHKHGNGDTAQTFDDVDPANPGDVPRKTRQRKRNRSKPTGMSRWTVAKDVAIIFIALIALVSGTYTSMLDILAFYGSEENP